MTASNFSAAYFRLRSLPASRQNTTGFPVSAIASISLAVLREVQYLLYLPIHSCFRCLPLLLPVSHPVPYIRSPHRYFPQPPCFRNTISGKRKVLRPVSEQITASGSKDPYIVSHIILDAFLYGNIPGSCPVIIADQRLSAVRIWSDDPYCFSFSLSSGRIPLFSAEQSFFPLLSPLHPDAWEILPPDRRYCHIRFHQTTPADTLW